MNWIYLYFPNLQLDRFHTQEKDLIPFVIINEHINEVVQLNTLAYQAGIRKHMGLASSLALSEQLKVTTYQQDLETQELNLIAETLYHVASDISLDPPKGIYLNLRPQLKFYGSLKHAWGVITKEVDNWHLNYHFANAHSPLSAKLLACSSADRLLSNKTAVMTMLESLPIQVLQLEAKTEQSLIRIGIRKIKHLLSIPLKELAIRFNLTVVNTIGYLRGEMRQKLSSFQPNTTFYRQYELMYEVTNSPSLARPMLKLLQQLETFLIRSNLTTQSLKFTLIMANQNSLDINIDSAIYQTSAKKWMVLVELKLEQLKLHAPVRDVSLEALKLQQQNFHTQDMLSTRQGNMEKAELLSILQTKLGKAAVYQLKYRSEHLPEKSTKRLSSPNSSCQPKLTNRANFAIRPAILLETPQPLAESIELISLPERIQSNWWNNHSVTRDYFVAQNSQQQKYWVFRRPDKTWYLHGYFS